MQIVGNQRTDGDCPESHIELQTSVGLAMAPVRVPKAGASREALEMATSEAELQDTLRAAQAKIESLRAAALEKKAREDQWKSERDNLTRRIAKIDAAIPWLADRMRELESECLERWTCDEPTADHILEHGRRAFVAERLPALAKELRKRLAEVEKELAAFEKKEFAK